LDLPSPGFGSLPLYSRC